MEIVVWLIAGVVGLMGLVAVGRAIDCCVD